MFEDKENLISAFNDSVNSIQRLNECWKRASLARLDKNFRLYRVILEQVEDELYYDAEELDNKGKKDYKAKLKDINKKISNSFGRMVIYNYIPSLREKERLLRRIQQECGKGSMYKPSNEDDFD